jgi:hypothetical protein
VEKVFHFRALRRGAALAYYLGIQVDPLVLHAHGQQAGAHLHRSPRAQGLPARIPERRDGQDRASQPRGRTPRSRRSSSITRSRTSRLLLQLKDKLEELLVREGRAELARQCFAAIPVLARLDVLGFVDLFEH